VKRLEVVPGAYLFAVAVNGKQVSRTLIQLEEVLRERGLTLSAGYSIVLPSNYTPFGGPGPKREQEKLFAAAGARVEEIAGTVSRRERGPIEKGPLWQRIAFTPIYRMTLPKLGGFDHSFRVDEKCTGCGTCARVCPAGNIELVDGKPAWQRRCEQCFACIHWCPREAIQIGKRSEKTARYHHPEVKLEEVIALAGGDERQKKAQG
jgi:ferredoxin